MEQEKISLSICMIVKNEERCLERCLKSLTPLREQLPCEVIVTDTGSTDKSIKIAEKYADKVLHFQWCNDFSAARNVGLEQARGEWIMVIDADEELVEDVSHLVKFFTSEERFHYRGCFIKKKNCFDAKQCRSCESLKQYHGESSEFLDYRVFRSDLHPRYVGMIHESVPYMEPTYTFDLTLYHDGYAFEDEKKTKEKKYRNASLLEKTLKENNLRDLRVLVHLLVEQDVVKKEIFADIIRVTEEVMYQNVKNMFAPGAFVKVAAYYWGQNEKEKALKICKDYLKFFTDKRCQLFEMDIRFIQSACLFQQKQYNPALKMIERYFELVEKYEKGQLDLFLMRTTSIRYASISAKEYMKQMQIRSYMALKDFKKAGELLKAVDFEKITSYQLFNFFVTVIQCNYMREANISLAQYYPILSKRRKEGTSEQQKAAQDAYNFLQNHIQTLPANVKKMVIQQIASTPEGKQDLQKEMEKAQQKNQKIQQLIENAKENVKTVMKEPAMKQEALDLVQRLLKLSPEDKEVQQWMEQLSQK